MIHLAARNAAGAWFVGISLVVLPAPVLAQNGPTVLSTVPASGAVNVPVSSSFMATFSAPMDTSATSVQLLDTSAFPPDFVTTAASWSPDGLKITCAPTPAFPPNATIIWSIIGRGTNGLFLSGNSVSGSFTTGSGGAPVPSVVGTIPDNGATNVPPTGPVILTFSEPMDTNKTSVVFRNSMDPLTLLSVTTSWSADHTILTNTPSPAFPAGSVILWTATGADPAGNVLASAMGTFVTAANTGPTANAATIVLLSRGEKAAQTDADLFQPSVPEFAALAAANPNTGVFFSTPSPGTTNVLANADSFGTVEFADTAPDAASFATNYPAGDYSVQLASAAGVALASLTLSDGQLPSFPQVANWQTLPFVVLNQSWSLQWEFAGGGAPVDYLRLRVAQNGVVIFTTPAPGASGALTGTANSVVVPATVFTNAGVAEVSLTAFSFRSLDTNSIPGTALRAAGHRTTTFELTVADPSVPAPSLLTTNLGAVPTSEPILLALAAGNGVKPLSFEVAGGALPPGLLLEPAGLLSGQTTNVGAFDATVMVTDLLGRSSTAPLHVNTVTLPPAPTPTLIENVARIGDPSLIFDIVGAAGSGYIVYRSVDLAHWLPYLATNLTAGRLTLSLPTDGQAAFFRVTAPGAVFPPPNPVSVTPVLNTNVTASALIDESGGSLSLTNAAGYVFTLTIPLGALEREETITMTDVAQVIGLPLDGGLSAAVQFGPEGLVFDAPVQLDITSPTDVHAASTVGFGSGGDGSQFALTLTFLTNRTVTQFLQHFSTAGTASGSTGSVQGQAQNTPNSAAAAYNQQLAAALQACAADPSCGGPGDIQGQLLDLDIKMGNQAVIPLLQQAVNDDSAIENAFSVWLEWARGIELTINLPSGASGDIWHGTASAGFGQQLPVKVSQLVAISTKAWSLATQAIVNGVDKCCKDCIAHKLDRLNRMINLGKDGDLLGLDNMMGQVNSCIQKCLVFQVEFDSTITSTSGGATATAHTKGTVKLKPMMRTANDDPLWNQSQGFFAGSHEWTIDEVHPPPPNVTPEGCVVAASPSSGQLYFPWVKIQLYSTFTVNIWPLGPQTLTVYAPQLTLCMAADPKYKPREHRELICPQQTVPVEDVFGDLFNTAHKPEIQPIPAGMSDYFSGPVYKMTGFDAGSQSDVIFSKSYNQSPTFDTTETTTIKVRHTPQQ